MQVVNVIEETEKRKEEPGFRTKEVQIESVWELEAKGQDKLHTANAASRVGSAVATWYMSSLVIVLSSVTGGNQN